MLPPQYAYLQDDVRESHLRSRHLHRSIGLISYSVAGVSIDSKTPPTVGIASPAKTTHTPQVQRTQSRRYSPASRYAGKVALTRRLQQFNQRVVRSKAGKPVSIGGYGDSPVVDRLAYLSETTLQTEGSEGEIRKPPHVSLRSGRRQPPLRLPSYSEYCELHKQDMIKAPSSAKSMRQASQAIARMEKLKKQLNGLSILLQECPGGWNRDKKVLYRLDKYPAQRPAILKTYKAVERHLVSDVKKVEVVETHSSSPAPKNRQEAYRKIKQRADDFTDSQCQQSQNLIDMLDRYELERPFLLHRKSRLLSQDQDIDPGRALQRLEEHRKDTDIARKERVEKARSQAGIYNEMLEYVRHQPGQPCEAELVCLDLVRNLLEEGWAMDREVVGRIREVMGETAGEVEALLGLMEQRLG